MRDIIENYYEKVGLMKFDDQIKEIVEFFEDQDYIKDLDSQISHLNIEIWLKL